MLNGLAELKWPEYQNLNCWSQQEWSSGINKRNSFRQMNVVWLISRMKRKRITQPANKLTSIPVTTNWSEVWIACWLSCGFSFISIDSGLINQTWIQDIEFSLLISQPEINEINLAAIFVDRSWPASSVHQTKLQQIEVKFDWT